MRNKHLCVFFCYNNYDHIVQSYESIINIGMDFFVVENYSKNTDKIKEYFKDKDLIRYILFENNIANTAMNIMIEDYEDILKQYEYITFSDCDLVPHNSKDLFSEIYKILDHDDIGLCSTSIDLSNLPNVPGSQYWIPKPNKNNIHDDYIDVDSGIHFMTIKRKNLNLFKNLNFMDSNIMYQFRKNGLKCVITKENKSYHLTWDLYHIDNEYYQFKVNSDIWNKQRCNYTIVK